jgi:hypothetical protein
VNDQAITRCKLEEGDLVRIGRNTMKFDNTDGFPNLDPIEVDLELPNPTQSQTWNFSRRLRVIESD